MLFFALIPEQNFPRNVRLTPQGCCAERFAFMQIFVQIKSTFLGGLHPKSNDDIPTGLVKPPPQNYYITAI